MEEQEEHIRLLEMEMNMSPPGIEKINAYTISPMRALEAFGGKVFGPDDGSWWQRFQEACREKGWEVGREGESSITIYPHGKDKYEAGLGENQKAREG